MSLRASTLSRCVSPLRASSYWGKRSNPIPEEAPPREGQPGPFDHPIHRVPRASFCRIAAADTPRPLTRFDCSLPARPLIPRAGNDYPEPFLTPTSTIISVFGQKDPLGISGTLHSHSYQDLGNSPLGGLDGAAHLKLSPTLSCRARLATPQCTYREIRPTKNVSHPKGYLEANGARDGKWRNSPRVSSGLWSPWPEIGFRVSECRNCAACR